MKNDLGNDLKVARDHLSRAALEGLEAARVLLDASLRASGIDRVVPGSVAGEVGEALDALVGALTEGRAFTIPVALGAPLRAALEREIKRWEERSQTDPDARPVLRAFLGLRELLWEFGLRRSDETPSAPQTTNEPSPARPEPPSPRKIRVERYDVES